jgi:hypothetical protein
MIQEICLRILKEIATCVLRAVGFVIGFVVSTLIESIIELRWFMLIMLTFAALIWILLQSPHRPSARIYLMDPAPARTWR